MPQRWKKVLLPLFAASMFFTACKKQFSSDTALSPIYTPSVIINSDDQILYGINPTNGLKNWQFSLPFANTANLAFMPSPLLYAERIYILGNSATNPFYDTLYKINSETGTIVSRFVIAPGVFLSMQATPVADANLIYLPASNDTLYVIDTTGVVKWKFNAGSSLVSSPVIYNGMVYFATTGGTVYALDKTQGAAVDNENWTCTPGSASFYSSPAISAPYLYIGSVADSNMYCLPLKAVTTGTFVTTTVTPRWTYKTKGGIYSSPEAVDGVCIFGCIDNKVYCLDTFLISPATVPGARWITPTTAEVHSSPVLVNNVVYIGSDDYNLYALNIIDGSVKWKFNTTGVVKSSPLVYGATVYIGSYSKYLYAVDTSMGTLKWSYNTTGQIECSPVIDDLSGFNQYNSQISGYIN